MRKLIITLLTVNGIWYIVSIVGAMTTSTSELWMKSLVGAFIASVFIGVLAAVTIIFEDVQEEETQETASMRHPVVSASAAGATQQNSEPKVSESSDVEVKVKESNTEWPF